MGIEFLAFNTENPYTNQLRGPPTKSNKTRLGRSNMWRVYLSPPNISQICGGLTLGKKGAKLCHAKNCTALKHPSSVPNCSLPYHSYLVLPGSHILHPLPLFNYKDFSEATLQKLLDASITIDSAVC